MPYTKKATISGDHGNIINFMSPMKMFDYLGAGKIIISSNIKVLREVLINNFNSVLIKTLQMYTNGKSKLTRFDLKKVFKYKKKKCSFNIIKIYLEKRLLYND